MQSKTASFTEQCFNVGSGYAIALLLWSFVLVPYWGFEVSMADNVAITSLFTAVSVVRGYLWRRLFNRFTTARSPG